MRSFELVFAVIPVAMAIGFIGLLLLVLRPSRRRAVAPLALGGHVSLYAVVLGGPFGGGSVQGRITATPYELVLEPAATGAAPWRVPLTEVRVLQRPSLGIPHLTLGVRGAPVRLVVDAKRQPSGYDLNDFNNARHRSTGAWFADVIEASIARAYGSGAPHLDP